MNALEDWRTILETNINEFLSYLVASLPKVVAAVIVLLIGWLVARLLRVSALKLGNLIDRATRRLAHGRGHTAPGAAGASSELFGGVVFWITILFFLAVAAQVLEIQAFSDWLAGVAAFLPTLFAGALIVAGGFLVSIVARDLVVAAGSAATLGQRRLIGRVVQIVILATAVIIGVDQIGLEVRFLVIITAVIAAAVLGGFAIAFSLGAQSFIANLIAAHRLRQNYRQGEKIRLNGYQGRIIEITQSSLLVETDEGEVELPARMIDEHPVIKLRTSDE